MAPVWNAPKIAILVMLMAVQLLNLDSTSEFAQQQDSIFLIPANHHAQHVLEKVTGTASLAEQLLDILITMISLVKLIGAGHAKITADHAQDMTFAEIAIQDSIFGLMGLLENVLMFVHHAELIHQAKFQLHFALLAEQDLELLMEFA